MKILILGTSNSLVKNGWTAGLRVALPDAEITNKSIGRSPGIQFAATLNNKLENYDIVFLDSLPNDEMLQNSLGDVTYSEIVMYEIISTISSKTRLVVVGIDLKSGFYDKPSPTFRRRKKTAISCDAVFLDFSFLLRKFPSGEAYKDNAHPRYEKAFAVGVAIGESLDEICAIIPETRSASDYSFNFLKIDPRSNPEGLPIVNRKNSLFNYDFVKLRASEYYQIDRDIALQFKCLGFYINRWETHCHAHLVNDSEARRIVLRYEPRPGEFEINFYPIKNGARINRIEVLDREYKYLPGSDWPGERTEIPADPQIFLGEMVFWKGHLSHRLMALRSEEATDRIQAIIYDHLVCE